MTTGATTRRSLPEPGKYQPLFQTAPLSSGKEFGLAADGGRKIISVHASYPYLLVEFLLEDRGLYLKLGGPLIRLAGLSGGLGQLCAHLLQTLV